MFTVGVMCAGGVSWAHKFNPPSGRDDAALNTHLHTHMVTWTCVHAVGCTAPGLSLRLTQIARNDDTEKTALDIILRWSVDARVVGCEVVSARSKCARFASSPNSLQRRDGYLVYRIRVYPTRGCHRCTPSMARHRLSFNFQT